MTKALLYTLASAPGTHTRLLLQARPQRLRRALRVNQLRTRPGPVNLRMCLERPPDNVVDPDSDAHLGCLATAGAPRAE